MLAEGKVDLLEEEVVGDGGSGDGTGESKNGLAAFLSRAFKLLKDELVEFCGKLIQAGHIKWAKAKPRVRALARVGARYRSPFTLFPCVHR